MRKLLLFLITVSVIGISSCTRDDVEEISQAEKELLVEQMLIELNKSAKAGKYQKFVTVVSQKSATESLSEAEVEALFLEIVGEDAQIFVDLYFQLKAINMTGEEFKSIAEQFEYLRPNFGSKISKDSDSEECDVYVPSLICQFTKWLSFAGLDTTTETPGEGDQ